MKNNFWDNLPKPFFVLAPMADVTDAAFRLMIAKYGKPDVMYTPFVSGDGLCSKGRDVLLRDLRFDESERPIVAQFFTAQPEHMYECAKLAVKLGFDGIDINMGCPDKAVVKQGAGAALIKQPKLAREIIAAAKKGAGQLPVSIKTRTGDAKDIMGSWLPELLAENPAAIIIHARTRKDMSKVPAKWHLIKQAVEIAKGSGTLIIGNGDVVDIVDARQKAEETGCDGVMLGRAIFGNPWLFANLPQLRAGWQIEHPASILPKKHRTKVGILEYIGKTPAAQSRNRVERSECAAPEQSREIGAGFQSQSADITVEQKLNAMVEHTKLFEKMLGQYQNFAIMKKHFKAYVHGFDGAKELRMKLMTAENAADVEKIVKHFLLSSCHSALRPGSLVAQARRERSSRELPESKDPRFRPLH